jgi:hypothetical protein
MPDLTGPADTDTGILLQTVTARPPHNTRYPPICMLWCPGSSAVGGEPE